jgi:hypothetical protein
MLPIVLGGSIYLFFRDRNNLLFYVINQIVPYHFLPRLHWIDGTWIANSLPDGLWTYASTTWLLQIWKTTCVFTLLPLIFAVATELGQSVSVIPGTFDPIDLWFYLLGYLLANLRTNEKAN